VILLLLSLVVLACAFHVVVPPSWPAAGVLLVGRRPA
jgi:hypothetical protein